MPEACTILLPGGLKMPGCHPAESLTRAASCTGVTLVHEEALQAGSNFEKFL